MKMSLSRTTSGATRVLIVLLVCVLALAYVARAMGATNEAPVGVALEGCVSTGEQGERSATFSGEMTATVGTAKMAMRIDVEERGVEELEFHTISAPGLGVWRWADPRVKIYKYVKQVTNLSSPATYRAVVRFHWLNDGGHVIRRAALHTARCVQPAVPTMTPASPSPPLE